MEKYISKSALVAEIERRRNICKKVVLDLRTEENKDYYQGKAEAYKEALDFLDTLEVKEVDLDKEIENLLEKEKAFVTDNREVKYYNGDSFNHIYELEFIAKHFFELGLKASQKGE